MKIVELPLLVSSISSFLLLIVVAIIDEDATEGTYEVLTFETIKLPMLL